VPASFRLGLQLNTTQRPFRWGEIKELALVAEACGFDSLWSEDHLYYRSRSGDLVGPWDSWTTLAGLAAVTERVRIGTLVTSLSMYSPLQLARMAASLDEMSGGRFVLGVGAGWATEEHAAVGASLDKRFGRFEEAFGALLDLFDTGHTEVRGRQLDFEGWLVPRPTGRRRPELVVGGLAPRLLRTALPEVDGWNWDGFHYDVEDFRADWSNVQERARLVGRDPETLVVSAHVVVRTDGAEGLPIDPISFRVIEGGVAEIASALGEFAEAGVDEFTLILDPARPAAIETLARAAQQAHT
jgi:alkanesulfonate monooxygenase SsuD/methylene tetrahydromethanopterin reductase-like flavin-dependent oxidoreductase (luciferase family)